jgi:Zn-dependent protease
MNMVRDIIMIFVPMLLSLTIHEYSHALAAYLLGDDTAASQGRLTLNPIAHIDLVGTIIIPFVSRFMLGGFSLIGWAKPVPVSPHNFRRTVSMRTGMIITAMAGPASNLVFAFVLYGVGSIIVETSSTPSEAAELVSQFITYPVRLNLALAVFNMIPLYPLDGSRLLPLSLQERMSRYSMFGMIALLFMINSPSVNGVILFLIRLLFFPIQYFWHLVL